MIRTVYSGKWAETQQNAKFCGSFVTCRVLDGVQTEVLEEGSFFTIATEVEVE